MGHRHHRLKFNYNNAARRRLTSGRYNKYDIFSPHIPAKLSRRHYADKFIFDHEMGFAALSTRGDLAADGIGAAALDSRAAAPSARGGLSDTAARSLSANIPQ
jgi:hypothetical protein